MLKKPLLCDNIMNFIQYIDNIETVIHLTNRDISYRGRVSPNYLSYFV